MRPTPHPPTVGDLDLAVGRTDRPRPAARNIRRATRRAVARPAVPAHDRQAAHGAARHRRALVTGDAIALGVAFLVVTAVGGLVGHPLRPAAAASSTAIGVALGLAGLRAQRLRDEHRLAIRVVELAGLARTGGWMLAGLVVTDRITGLGLPAPSLVAGPLMSVVLLVTWRSMRRAGLDHRRRGGHLGRRTLVVGTGARALDLVRIAEVHPEAGVVIVGMVGRREDLVVAGRGGLWLGDADDLPAVIAAVSPERIVISTTDLDRAGVEAVMRAGRDAGTEVVVHAGLPGLAATRLSRSAIAHDPVLHVQVAGSAGRSSRVTKRVVDVMVAGCLLAIAAPVMVAVAVAVKVGDGGPVCFRQQRVGRHGASFGMLKFRTMVVDAEARRGDLATANGRHGPLFKAARDPRITRVGHVLRRTSLDELPQLLNVIRGDMSLVGPRPALRSEVDQFPADLHDRHLVRPGITGLWQVEARDNPAFDAYHRLDLHYVHNWSPALDVAVLVATVEHLFTRAVTGGRTGS
ncbi:MAG: exopolysaccharide biosynthesis polyprenyl glycosylphosphotransferase [Ilumatobacteraceae bacterium]